MPEERVIERKQADPQLEEILRDLEVELNLDSVLESSDNVPEAVNRGRERSPKNVKNSLRLYFEHLAGTGEDLEAAKERLVAEIRRVQETLCLAHNATGPGALRRLESGTIRSIFDVPAEVAGKKHGGGYLPGYMQNRRETEEALGWVEGENPAYLVLEDDFNKGDNGAAAYWGSVRFSFDFQKLRDRSTFTESDSMNVGGLPRELRGLGKDVGSKGESAQCRQVSAEQVAIVKAIFNLLPQIDRTALIKDQGIAKLRDLGYIEAQVGGGIFLEDSLQGIDINARELRKEVEKAFLNWAQQTAYLAAEPEIGWEEYRKYSRVFRLNDPRDKDPRYKLKLTNEEIKAKAEQLLQQKFQEIVDQIKDYCRQREIKFELRGDL